MFKHLYALAHATKGHENSFLDGKSQKAQTQIFLREQFQAGPQSNGSYTAVLFMEDSMKYSRIGRPDRVHFRLPSLAMVFFFLTLAFSGGRAFAQTPNGSLSGDVTDASGALVPRATVHLRNENTGVENQFTTTSAGHYVFSNLIPGSYQVTVSQSAFKTEVRTGVVISLGSTTGLNISLAPGATSETVTVNADALKIETESTEVGTVVT